MNRNQNTRREHRLCRQTLLNLARKRADRIERELPLKGRVVAR